MSHEDEVNSLGIGKMYPHHVKPPTRKLIETDWFAILPDFQRRVVWDAMAAEVKNAYDLGYYRGQLNGAIGGELVIPQEEK